MFRIIALPLFALLFSAMAYAEQPNPDPWEGFNRKVFAFNEQVDNWVLRPTAVGYKKVTPQPLRASFSNFFANLRELKNIASNLLQLKLGAAASDTGRLLTNSTLGFFGFYDVATPLGMRKHNEDFGQVLGYWGVKSGPYVMWPLFGPSTLRDSAGGVAEYASNITVLSMNDSNAVNYSLTALLAVNTRANLLDAEGLVQGDRYTFIRSFYLQNREYLIRDGKIEDDFGDEDWDSWDDDWEGEE